MSSKAIQLELDSLLPIKVSALCRAWADERVKLRGEGGDHQEGHKQVIPTLSSSTSGEHSVAPHTDHCTILFAVVDAINLHSSVGLQSLDTFCTLRTVNWEGGHSVVNVTGLVFWLYVYTLFSIYMCARVNLRLIEI